MDNTTELDLHGETKDKAVSKLVSFLDQIRYTENKKKEIWRTKKKSGGGNCNTVNHKRGMETYSYMVAIITGSGSHSNSGPVIRNAVEKVLQKRQMTYNLTCKKGVRSY